MGVKHWLNAGTAGIKHNKTIKRNARKTGNRISNSDYGGETSPAIIAKISEYGKSGVKHAQEVRKASVAPLAPRKPVFKHLLNGVKNVLANQHGFSCAQVY